MQGLRGERGCCSCWMVDARIVLGVNTGHKVFEMPLVFNKLSVELFAGHFAPVIKDVGAGCKGASRTMVGFTL